MLFVIYALDAPDAPPKRAAHYPAHHAFLDKTANWDVAIVMSGPLTQDDGQTPIGSLMVIDAPNRDAAEAFHHADPFHAAGVWAKTTITAFHKKRG
jgi:uncharacterized protein YciI